MESIVKEKNEKGGVWLLILLGWLVYATSYLGRVNYQANITQIIDFYDITKVQAGTVPTFFFFAYGIGQVINGILCKKYNIRWMVFGSLIISATINFIIAVNTNFWVIKWLWLINGVASAVLWPTLIRMFAESLPKKALGKSSVIMGTSIASGLLVIYGLSSIYAAIDKFKLAFYTASFVGVTVAFVWLFFYKKAAAMSKREKIYEEEEQEFASDVKENRNKNKHEKIFSIAIYSLCFYAVGINLIKDGLTTWLPSILKEEYAMTDSLSILLTLFLPIVAMFGNACALKVHKKIPDYVSHCALVFAIIFAFICFIIGSLTFKKVAFMLIGLILVNFLASSLNSLITSIFPVFMREKINSGLYAGVLNGFCYVGSTISSYGLGFIADNFAWSAVFWTLAGFCILACIVFLIYALLRRVLGTSSSSFI